VRRLFATFVLFTAAASTRGGGEVPFRHVVIDRDAPVDMHSKTTGDLSGDGLEDLVVAGTKGLLVWYEYPTWTRRVIASEGGGWSCDLRVVDIDGDGRKDVVASDWFKDQKLVWFRNPGKSGAWTMHVVGRIRAHDIAPADLNRDGRVDLVTRQQGPQGGTIELWIQAAAGEWQHRQIECPLGEGIHLADIDGDRNVDIIAGKSWYENSGDPLKGPWKPHVFAPQYEHRDVFPWAADINRDGRLDTVMMPTEKKLQHYRAAWYEAPADRRNGTWKEHLIEDNLETVHHSLAVADMDGDGELDIVTAEMHQGVDPDEVKIYFNEGRGKGWRKQVVATTGSHNIRVVDIGGDGDLDIFGSNWTLSSQVDLWENVSAHKIKGKKP
jgi:hypothetical protein